MEKDVNKLIAQRKFNIAINFIDKLDILMALQDKSEDNEESKLINFTRNSKDLKVHFLLDNNNYRISSEKVFDNFFNTFTNINDDLKIEIKESLYLSHSSLYKVKKIEDDYIILFDLLLYKEEKVSKDLLENIELNDYLFARIAQFNNYNYIIHILNILNKEIGEIFYSMILEFLASSFNKNVKENRKILFDLSDDGGGHGGSSWTSWTSWSSHEHRQQTACWPSSGPSTASISACSQQHGPSRQPSQVSSTSHSHRKDNRKQQEFYLNPSERYIWWLSLVRRSLEIFWAALLDFIAFPRAANLHNFFNFSSRFGVSLQRLFFPLEAFRPA